MFSSLESIRTDPRFQEFINKEKMTLQANIEELSTRTATNETQNQLSQAYEYKESWTE